MRRWLIFLTVLAAAGLARAASDRAVTDQVRAQLIASVSAVQPGSEIWLGLQQKIIPHWHTYWINPGDSGLPTKIEWRLPAGAAAGAIQWPLPTRFDQGGVTNYGYADEVTLLTPVSVPSSLKTGENFAVAAQASWLVCEEICIPQHAELALTLPVAVAAPAQPINPLIAAALAHVPQRAPWQAQIDARDQHLSLRLVDAAAQLRHAARIEFFADSWGRVEHAAEQTYRIENRDVVIELRAGEKKLKGDEALSGVLRVVGSDSRIDGFGISAAPASAPPAASAPKAELSVLTAAALALLGGIILNLMPCVFPVLSIKALALLQHGAASPLQNRLQGLTYTAGVLLSFAALAALLILLKAGGAQIGWGFQYQSPLFVLLVADLMFAVGLSLSGVFVLGGSIAGAGSTLANKPGYAGSFFTGVLAALVATPCTAPFMGAAIGFALNKPPLQLLAVFLSLGFGLALPYLLLAFWPSLQRRLPRPGLWMEQLKQVLAFPMYGAAVWLLWVLAQQAGADAVAAALGGMVAIAFSAWLYQNTRAANRAARTVGAAIAVLAVATAIFSGYGAVARSDDTHAISSRAGNGAGNWEIYSAQRLQQLRADGKPVFVNFTAAWCISCLVNERVALKQDGVATAFAQQGIAYLKGDWTNQDAGISAKLAEFGRSGVPLYLYYPRGTNARPVVLPQILTPDIVLSAIDSANAIAANPVSSTQ